MQDLADACCNDEGYGKLESYLDELKRLNPGTVTHFETKLSTKVDGKRELEFAFVMLNVFAKATVLSKINVRTIDGGHLYHGSMKFVALIMEMITGDGSRIPFAVALCDSENEKHWTLFLESVSSWQGEHQNHEILSMKDVLNNSKSILMSDRDKGIGSACQKCLPECIDRKCIKHIERNFLVDPAVMTDYNVEDAQKLFDETSAATEVGKNLKRKKKKAIYYY